MIQATLCEIIDGNKLLLKRASRGISKGKWNGVGGKIDEKETPLKSVIREAFEESGLKIKYPIKHGELTFFKGGEPFFNVHIFSAKKFEGDLKESDEGELKWFDADNLPYGEMWPDDIHWMPLMLKGKKFDGSFYFDENMKELIRYRIETKDEER